MTILQYSAWEKTCLFRVLAIFVPPEKRKNDQQQVIQGKRVQINNNKTGVDYWGHWGWEINPETGKRYDECEPRPGWYCTTNNESSLQPEQ